MPVTAVPRWPGNTTVSNADAPTLGQSMSRYVPFSVANVTPHSDPDFTRLHVLTFDNRDVGRSQRFPETTYTIADMADDTHGLLSALHIESAHVLGQSMGGMIAQELSVRHPEMVKSLTLFYTTPDSSYVIGQDAVEAREALPEARNREEAVANHLANEQSCASRTYQFPTQWIKTVGGLMYDRGYDPSGVIRQRESAFRSPSRIESVTTITAPTAIVHGTDDLLIDYRVK